MLVVPAEHHLALYIFRHISEPNVGPQWGPIRTSSCQGSCPPSCKHTLLVREIVVLQKSELLCTALFATGSDSAAPASSCYPILFTGHRLLMRVVRYDVLCPAPPRWCQLPASLASPAASQSQGLCCLLRSVMCDMAAGIGMASLNDACCRGDLMDISLAHAHLQAIVATMLLQHNL